MNTNRRVVVTGMGAVTPLGNNVADTWKNLKKDVYKRQGQYPPVFFSPSLTVFTTSLFSFSFTTIRTSFEQRFHTCSITDRPPSAQAVVLPLII